MSITGYRELIIIIKEELSKRCEFQKEIYRINAEGNRDVHGPRFSKFANKEVRDKFIKDLMAKIEHVDTYLNDVAGRHKERHRELVDLLIEQFEIEEELSQTIPKFAGGLFHQQKSEIRKDEIKLRIEEIIGTPITY